MFKNFKAVTTTKGQKLYINLSQVQLIVPEYANGKTEEVSSYTIWLETGDYLEVVNAFHYLRLDSDEADVKLKGETGEEEEEITEEEV